MRGEGVTLFVKVRTEGDPTRPVFDFSFTPAFAPDRAPCPPIDLLIWEEPLGPKPTPWARVQLYPEVERGTTIRSWRWGDPIPGVDAAALSALPPFRPGVTYRVGWVDVPQLKDLDLEFRIPEGGGPINLSQGSGRLYGFASDIDEGRKLVAQRNRKPLDEWLRDLGSPDPDARKCAAYVLPPFDPADGRVVDGLTRLLGDEDPGVRQESLLSLEGLAPAASRAVPAILELLQDPHYAIREAAFFALGAIGPSASAAIPKLVECVRQPHGADAWEEMSMRASAARALGCLGPPGIQALAEFSRDPVPRIRYEAIISMDWHGSEGIPALQAAARGKYDDTRLQAICLLFEHQVSDPSSVDFAIAKLGSDDRQEADFAAWALKRLGAAVLPRLEEASRSDSNPKVRERAAALVLELRR